MKGAAFPARAALVYVVGQLALGVAALVIGLLTIAFSVCFLWALGVAFRGDLILGFLYAMLAAVLGVAAFLVFLLADWIRGLYGDDGGSR